MNQVGLVYLETVVNLFISRSNFSSDTINAIEDTVTVHSKTSISFPDDDTVYTKSWYQSVKCQ